MRLRRGGWLAVVLVMVWAVVGWAESIDLDSAEDAARAHIDRALKRSEIYRASMSMRPDLRVGDSKPLTDGSTSDPLAYVFELAPKGYLVVTMDTRLVPVVAYSYTSPFSWEESPQNILLDMLRQDMANRLRALDDKAIAAEVIEDNERSWDGLLGDEPPQRYTYTAGVYGPWTTDPSWHQGSPYWDECPMDPNEPPVGTHRCVVGCVATALAQILNYWQTPTSVTFQSSDDYTSTKDPGDGYGTRTIPITASTADFSGLSYNDCNPSNAPKADLSYAAGVSVRMGYSSNGSGAYTFQIARALAGTAVPNFVDGEGTPIPQANQRWGYHSADLRTYSHSWGSPWTVSQATFYNDLKSNMMQARPAAFSISRSSGGGHCILVDGYNPNDETYHLNYGWGGTNDGWYSLPSVLPGPPTSTNYDVIDAAVYNITPTTSTYTLATTTSGAGSGTVQALPGTGALTCGTHALLTATPSPGSTFDGWSGDLSGSANPAIVILDGSKTVNAVFSDGGPISTKKWTVMVYLSGDNNLGGGTPSDADFMDFDEIETALVSSGSALNVVVLWDLPGTNDSYIYWVQPDGTEGSLATYTLGVNKWAPPWGTEVNMGAQSNLTSFLDWTFDNFASDYWSLILWNHGGGWAPKSKTYGESDAIPSTYLALEDELTDILLDGNDAIRPLLQLEKDPLQAPAPRAVTAPGPDDGVCWDDTDGGDYLTTKEAAYGIENSTRSWVDNLGIDACLMQMLEVAYEFYDTPTVAADYLTASEASEWGYGWAYHEILSAITTSTTPLQLAQLWGTTRSTRHISGGLDTISSVFLWEIADLAADVSALADRLTTLLATSSEYQHILYAKLFAEWFPYTSSSYIDLGDFCEWLAVFLDDVTASSLAQDVTTQLAATVIAMSNGSPFSLFGSANGLSIYLPHGHDVRWDSTGGGPSLSNYNGTNLAFCADHTWDEFVTAWLAADHVDPYESNDSPAAAYDRGTAYDGDLTYLCREADFDDETADWYKMTIPFWFDLDAGVWCTEYLSDTVLYAYDSLSNAQADSYFATDDDGMMSLGYYSLGSRIQQSTCRPGTYYFKVVPYDGAYGIDEDYEIWLRITRGADSPATFRVDSEGYVYLDGTLHSSALETGFADVAEWVNVSEPVESGDVLELDPLHPGQYRIARGGCSPNVAGVVSTDPGLVLGGGTRGERTLLALAGFVPVKACDEGGPIRVGDLVVVASRGGHVRRWNQEEGCGFIVGKALESLIEGEGLILVLLTR